MQIAQRIAGADAGRQRRHVERIAAVDFKGLDLLRRHVLLHGSRLGLQLRSGGADLDGFVRLADAQQSVERKRRIRIQFILRAFKALKARGFRGDRVQSRRQVWNRVIARFVGCNGMLFVGGFVADHDLRIRHHGPGRVLHKADDRSEVRLSESKAAHKQCEKRQHHWRAKRTHLVHGFFSPKANQVYFIPIPAPKPTEKTESAPRAALQPIAFVRGPTIKACPTYCVSPTERLNPGSSWGRASTGVFKKWRAAMRPRARRW